MLLDQKNINWDELPTYQKRGWCVLADGSVDFDIPRFTGETRDYINKHLVQVEQ